MARYISNTQSDKQEMLKAVGVSDIDALYSDVPDAVKLRRRLNIPEAQAEPILMKNMMSLAKQNSNIDEYTCFLGAGAYDHYVPALIDQLALRQEFYTAYTPYQPEISQGTLQAIFEYQTLICQLTGMAVSNASMYDGATSLTEAAIMACETTKRKTVIIAKTVNPESRHVLHTYAKVRKMNVIEIGYQNGQLDIVKLKSALTPEVAAVIIQTPNFFGVLEDTDKLADLVHANKSLLIVSCDPISLALFKSPGEIGADIAVGEGQSLGNPLSFGGPYLGFMAVTDKLMRKMPGRIVGQTVDHDGNRGFVLTLQTREQHIRREKATSNICSNQALNALIATMYLSVMGREGIKEVARLCLNKAHYAHSELLKTGKFTEAFTAPFFKEFTLLSKDPVQELNEKLLAANILGGYRIEKDYSEIKNGWLVAVTEKRTKEEIDNLIEKVAR